MIGTWTVPTAVCNTRELRFASEWVGLDDLNDETVEQLGTTAYCFLGRAYYTPRIEMFPAASQPPPNPITVAPGQSITASVIRHGYKYTLTLTDNTTKQHFTQTETDAALAQKDCGSSTATLASECPLNASAEWIVERPAFPSGFGFQIVPLAEFGAPIGFTTVKASGFTLRDANPLQFTTVTTLWQINIASSGLNTTNQPFYDLDATSGLKGASFHCTWLDSY